MQAININATDENIFFSIVVVTLNAEKYIKTTLLSIVGQEFDDYELIIVDGMSKDGTLDIINVLVSGRATIISEHDNGIFDAMNKGLDLCSGKYVYFLNAGDYLASSSVLLDIQRHIIGQGYPDVLYGDIITYSEDSSLKQRLIKHPDNLTKEFLLKRTICHQSIFAKNELFANYGKFDDAFKICADYAWLLDMVILKKANIIHIHYAVGYYSIDGLSSTKNYVLERYSALKRCFSTPYLVRNKYLPWAIKKTRKKTKHFLGKYKK